MRADTELSVLYKPQLLCPSAARQGGVLVSSPVLVRKLRLRRSRNQCWGASAQSWGCLHTVFSSCTLPPACTPARGCLWSCAPAPCPCVPSTQAAGVGRWAVAGFCETDGNCPASHMQSHFAVHGNGSAHTHPLYMPIGLSVLRMHSWQTWTQLPMDVIRAPSTHPREVKSTAQLLPPFLCLHRHTWVRAPA